METAVILEGARTPIGTFLGSFADTPAVELGSLAAREALRRAHVDAEAIDQTIFGHARQAGNGPNTGRQVSVRGTFNAAALSGLGAGNDAADRTAKATEQTAKNTKKVADAVGSGGLTFA